MQFTMIARSAAAGFGGIDLHKDTLTACVIDAVAHAVWYAKIICTCRSRIREYFSPLPWPSRVAIKVMWLTLSKQEGKKAAAVAVAHKRLVSMWTLVRKDELSKPGGPVAPVAA